MKLTFDQIKSILFGVNHSWEENGILYFRRVPESVVQKWGVLRQDFMTGACAPAGIRLDFHTDSNSFAMLPTAPAPFDLLVDNVLVRSFTWEDYENTNGWLRVSLPEGEHRVTLLFPYWCTVALGIRELELDEDAWFRPHVYDRRILFIGDSITHGVGAGTSYMSYAWRFSRALNADCRNIAVSGTFFAPSTFPHDMDFDPDIIIVAYGTNDWGFFSGPDRLELRSREFLDLLCARYPSSKIFGITPLWRSNRNEIRSVGTFDTCCEIVRQAHKNHGIHVIEGFGLVPNQPQFFTDGLHPNDNGHACYAENLLLMMKPYL